MMLFVVVVVVAILATVGPRIARTHGYDHTIKIAVFGCQVPGGMVYRVF